MKNKNLPIYACILEYNGSYFHGFQRQKGLLTVQSTLEEAIQIVTKEKTRITAAGRTDTGVHAQGMVVSFPLEKQVSNLAKFLLSLNAISHPGVAVLAIQEMPKDFNARFSCTEREYQFLILHSKFISPLWIGRAHRIHSPFQLEMVQAHLAELLGKKNFKSFAKSTSTRGVSTERQITAISIEPSLDTKGLYKLMIKGTGFLHNMIRIIVGTILDMGTGKIQSDFKTILESENRKNAGKTLPPDGLYFYKAYYKNYPQIESMYHSHIPSC